MMGLLVKKFPETPSTLTRESIDSFAHSIEQVCLPEDKFIQKFDGFCHAKNINGVIAMLASSTSFTSDTRTHVNYGFAEFIKQLLAEGKLETALILENLLYSTYVKKIETEEHYQSFFSPLSRAYRDTIPKNKNGKIDSTGYLFVLHTASFLAHVNPLLAMLQTNGFERNKRENIAIVVLDRVSKTFYDTFKNIGIDIFSCEHIQGIAEKIAHIERIRLHAGYHQVIWQCLPIWISLAARLISNLNWWSVKFHPGIFDLRVYIGSVGGQKDFVMHGNQWRNFTAPISIKNLSKNNETNWEIRRNQFGCFTREELIDNSDYWNLVQALLARHTNLSFHYAGRKPVHHKWAHPKSAVINRIKFLGWLKSPETKLTEYAFLLDPTPLGHGNLAREAFAASIPIIYKEQGIQPPTCTIHKLLMTSPDIEEAIRCNKNGGKFQTSYSNIDELIEISVRLLHDQQLNMAVGRLYRSLLKTQFNPKAWDEFRTTLDEGNK